MIGCNWCGDPRPNEDTDSPQPSLRDALKNLTFITSMAAQKVERQEITPEESVERVKQEITKAEQAIERLLASAKLENSHVTKQYSTSFVDRLAYDQAFDQGAAAQYGAILVALGVKE